MLNKSNLITIIESAFKPLECVAELQNYNHRLGFRVYFEGRVSYTHVEPNVNMLVDEGQLKSLINYYRNLIESNGISLMPWVFLNN